MGAVVGDGSSLVPEGVLAGLGSGVPSSSISNVSFQAGGDPVWDVVAAVPVPEPSTLLLLASGIAVAARRLSRARREKNLCNPADS